MNDAHEAARQLALARWGSRGLDKAVNVVVSRSAELNPDQLASLAEVVGQQEQSDG